jgi:beta-galactosidase
MKPSATFGTAILMAVAVSLAARPNLALNKVCKASSVEGQLTPAKAVDGPKTQASRWGSNYQTDKNKDSAWIFVDLGKRYLVDSLAIYWEHSGARHYAVQAWNSAVDTPSHDDSGWKTLHTDTTLQYQPRPVDMCLSFIRLQAVDARYIRIRCYQRLFEFGYSIMELEVYGEEGGTGLRKPVTLPGRAWRNGADFSLTGRRLPVTKIK